MLFEKRHGFVLKAWFGGVFFFQMLLALWWLLFRFFQPHVFERSAIRWEAMARRSTHRFALGYNLEL